MGCAPLAIALLMPILAFCSNAPEGAPPAGVAGIGIGYAQPVPIECGSDIGCLVEAGKGCQPAHGSITLSTFGYVLSWDLHIDGCSGGDVLYGATVTTPLGTYVGQCHYPQESFGSQAFGTGPHCEGFPAP